MTIALSDKSDGSRHFVQSSRDLSSRRAKWRPVGARHGVVRPWSWNAAAAGWVAAHPPLGAPLLPPADERAPGHVPRGTWRSRRRAGACRHARRLPPSDAHLPPRRRSGSYPRAPVPRASTSSRRALALLLAPSYPHRGTSSPSALSRALYGERETDPALPPCRACPCLSPTPSLLHRGRSPPQSAGDLPHPHPPPPCSRR